MSCARPRDDVEAGDDFRGLVEDRRDEYTRGLVVNEASQPVRERLRWPHSDLDDVEAFLLKTIELAANGVELPIRRDQPLPRAERQRR